MDEIRLIIDTRTVADFFDILLVAVPFYIVFSLLRESRSLFALWGFITVLAGSMVLYLIAKVAGLQATALIYERFWIILVLLFLIVFQGDLKKSLADVGRTRFFRALFPHERHVLSELISAVATMSESRVGALIVLERGTSLKPYLSTGTLLDAVLASEAIRSIFTPASPLHDGALLISGNRILAGSCILPLTENPSLSRDLGTRHRAAIGLSEETDALVIVVSEQTGSISLAHKGKIQRALTTDQLQKRLGEELELKAESREGEAYA